MYTGHPFQQGLEGACRAQMTEILKRDPAMVDKLIPSFHPGCRRLTPGDGYLECFEQANASLSLSPITQITPTGIRSSPGLGAPEVEEEFDMIVCATGFDTSFIPQWDMRGLGGVSVADKWKTEPRGFFAVNVDEMPNYFMFNGPNAVISHGSVLTQVSWTCDYLLRWAKKIAEEDIKYVSLTLALSFPLPFPFAFLAHPNERAPLTWAKGH